MISHPGRRSIDLLLLQDSEPRVAHDQRVAVFLPRGREGIKRARWLAWRHRLWDAAGPEPSSRAESWERENAGHAGSELK